LVYYDNCMNGISQEFQASPAPRLAPVRQAGHREFDVSPQPNYTCILLPTSAGREMNSSLRATG